MYGIIGDGLQVNYALQKWKIKIYSVFTDLISDKHYNDLKILA